MTALAAERSDLTRWAACALVVLGVHAAAGAALLARHDPVGVGDQSEPVIVDLSPYVPPTPSMEDLPPGPLQQQAAPPAPEQKVERTDETKPDEKVEAKVEPEPEKIEVPPAPVPPVAALPPPEAVHPPPPSETMVEPAPPSDTPPAPATTAPPRERHASAEEINKWHTDIATRINSHLVFPPAARAHHQSGEVQTAFTFDRAGRLISSKVAESSGSAALDQAALETLKKAQPFPLPPAGMSGDAFTFKIPVRFRFR